MTCVGPNIIANRAKLFQIIKERSYAEGDFVLASGKKSRFYLDMKRTMFTPEGANLLAELLLDEIRRLETRVDLIGGLAMGAVPLVTGVMMLSAGGTSGLPGFIVRKEVKDHGTKHLIETGKSLEGKNVVILEDVTTSGQSAMIAVHAAQNAGANVVLVLAVVDREEGAAEFYREKDIPFTSLYRLREFRAGAEH